MLIIRKEQMAVFQEQAEQDFILSVIKQLRNDHPDVVKDVPEDTLHKRVAYGVRRAREYGMTWKNNLTTFVTLMFNLSPNFNKHPVFQKYLTDEKVPPDDRLGILLKETREKDWQDALQSTAQMKWPKEIT